MISYRVSQTTPLTYHVIERRYVKPPHTYLHTAPKGAGKLGRYIEWSKNFWWLPQHHFLLQLFYRQSEFTSDVVGHRSICILLLICAHCDSRKPCISFFLRLSLLSWSKLWPYVGYALDTRGVCVFSSDCHYYTGPIVYYIVYSTVVRVGRVAARLCVSLIGVPVMVHLGGGARPNLPEF